MSARILLLEDDGAFALDVKWALVPLGCEVTIVSEGNAGLARAVSDRFDLIIVCAELHGMNGFRVCNRLKKDPAVRPTPLLMMWTDASRSALDEHMKLPTRADGYVRKPFSPSDLRGQVRAFVPSAEAVPSLRSADVADGWEARTPARSADSCPCRRVRSPRPSRHPQSRLRSRSYGASSPGHRPSLQRSRRSKLVSRGSRRRTRASFVKFRRHA